MMTDSTPNIDQYRGNYYIGPDEVLRLRQRIKELEERLDAVAPLPEKWREEDLHKQHPYDPPNVSGCADELQAALEQK